MPIKYELKTQIHFILPLILLLFTTISCNKLVRVPNPISSVTSNQVYSSDATATAAMMGIYSYMTSTQSWSNFSTSAFLGLSADELTDEISGYEGYDPFLINNLTALNTSDEVGSLVGSLWQSAYFDIYSANAVISGLQSSTNVSSATVNQLAGEAKFIRAFCYFYLTNIFGDIPLVLTTDFNKTVLLHKSPQEDIYKQIISDLIDAQGLMISDYSLSGGMPIRANKWAATALLARVYQYQGQWQKADSAAAAVINSGLFSLVPLPVIPETSLSINPDSDAFAANSKEAILQLQSVNAYPNCTWEGYLFVPYGVPLYWMPTQLINAFENGDLRWVNWVDSGNFGGNMYYYPFKYKIEYGSPGTPCAENYMLLRLAEQYLIRAEAEANGASNGPTAAVADLNIIRIRAGLPPLSPTIEGDSLAAAIRQEYRIEFFAEWGHRWLDLKRWGTVIQTLDTISYKAGHINSTQLLYPIPIAEIQTDPNLTQNKGY